MAEEEQTAEDAYFQKALDIVREAGTLLVEAFHKQRDAMDARTRKSEETTTETDAKVEKLIVEKLTFHFPTHECIGEEGTLSGDTNKVDWDETTPTWIIDPIDGTTNFVHRMPQVAICLALTIKRVTILGIVYNPITGDLYTARKGKGAFKNGFQIKTSHAKEMKKALVMSSGGRHIASAVGSKRAAVIYTTNLQNLYDAKVGGVRWLGIPSLSMCMVAEGAADIYFDFGLYCWNMAAPVLVILEAGGHVADVNGKPYDLMGRRILATASSDLISDFTTPPLKIELITFPSQLNS